MLITINGVQLQIIDLGGGLFEIRPVDAVVDPQPILDELGRIKTLRNIEDSTITSATADAIFHAAQETAANTAASDATIARDAHQVRIQELRDFLVAAGEPDPGT